MSLAEAPVRTYTAEQAQSVAGADAWELVDGVLWLVSPPGGEHGGCIDNLHFALGSHVRARQLGKLFAAETGFLIARNPDTLLAPDIAFITQERVPRPLPRGWLQTVPDLIVEVVSPPDRIGEVIEKVGKWLEAGVRLVWVVYPAWRSVQVHRLAHEVRLLGESAFLEGDDVVPGFRMQVTEVFKP